MSCEGCAFAPTCEAIGECLTEAVARDGRGRVLCPLTDKERRQAERNDTAFEAWRNRKPAAIEGPSRMAAWRSRNDKWPPRYGPNQEGIHRCFGDDCRFEAICTAADQCLNWLADKSGWKIAHRSIALKDAKSEYQRRYRQTLKNNQQARFPADITEMAERLTEAGWTVRPPKNRIKRGPGRPRKQPVS